MFHIVENMLVIVFLYNKFNTLDLEKFTVLLSLRVKLANYLLYFQHVLFSAYIFVPFH